VLGNFAATSPNFGSLQLPNGSLQSAHFWVSRSLALRLQCRNPASLGAANKAAKPQFASAQRCFRKGNGGVCKHAVLLESPFLIRIGSRDPGQNFLA
jgi:hypothetical protein